MFKTMELIGQEVIHQVVSEASLLLQNTGVIVGLPAAAELLIASGATIDNNTGSILIPESLIDLAFQTVPHKFFLHGLSSEFRLDYSPAITHFNPGSSAVHVLDSDTLEHRLPVTSDLIRIAQLAELLPEFSAQSTAIVCNDVPKAISDLYRLYIILTHSKKPVVTGAFSIESGRVMIEMLAPFSGTNQIEGKENRAIFDVCPTPPLNWSKFASQNLIDLARYSIPVQIVSMPLAGATAPVTMFGSIVQHTAECLSGITIHQLANPGAPIVWGGAPAVFDMRHGTTPSGAIETMMIIAGYAQIGRSLDIPTQAYLVTSDAKIIDAQAGWESGLGALIGVLAGVNMISGAGMLDFLACQSPEKLVIDAEIIAQVKRIARGIGRHTDTLGLEFFKEFDFNSSFLKQKATSQIFKKEQSFPSNIVDRGSNRTWEQGGRKDIFVRAKERVLDLIPIYKRPDLPDELVKDLYEIVTWHAKRAGLNELPFSPFR
jgi:trimethylamine---corrinoid protein Co-methyltransferase